MISEATKHLHKSYMTGMKGVISNLEKEMKKIEGNITSKGMENALNFIKKEAVKITPVDTGNLANSFVNEVKTTKNETIGIIKNEANTYDRWTLKGIKGIPASKKREFYALYVHEMPNIPHAEGKTWKFLQFAIDGNQKNILNILARSAKQ